MTKVWIGFRKSKFFPVCWRPPEKRPCGASMVHPVSVQSAAHCGVEEQLRTQRWLCRIQFVQARRVHGGTVGAREAGEHPRRRWALGAEGAVLLGWTRQSSARVLRLAYPPIHRRYSRPAAPPQCANGACRDRETAPLGAAHCAYCARVHAWVPRAHFECVGQGPRRYPSLQGVRLGGSGQPKEEGR